MFKNAWEEYKAKNNVTPADLLNKNNYTSEEISKKRMEICNGCDRLFHPTNQCKECGCIMNLKTKLIHAKCPLEKW